MNLPKRVPVFAKPQEGISMRNWFRARMILSGLLEVMAGPQGDRKRVHTPWLAGHALSVRKRTFRNAKCWVSSRCRSRQCHDGNTESLYRYGVGPELSRSGRIKRSGLIHGLDLTTRGARNGQFQFAIAF